SRIGDLALLGGETVLLALPLYQIAARDLHLLADRVAGEPDYLHAVEQRTGDGIELIGGRDEQRLAEIEWYAEVIVSERRVLCGIEHLKQRRRRVTLDAASELVDFIEHQHAVAGAGLAQRLDDVPGQRADIGAAMAPDLGFVMHAAQADA